MRIVILIEAFLQAQTILLNYIITVEVCDAGDARVRTSAGNKKSST